MTKQMLTLNNAFKNIQINKDLFQIHTEIFYTDPAEVNIIDKLTIPANERQSRFPVPYLFYYDYPNYSICSKITPGYNKKILALPDLTLKWYQTNVYERGYIDDDLPLIIKEKAQEGSLIFKWHYDGAIQHRAFIIVSCPDRSYTSLIKGCSFNKATIEKLIYINSNIYNYFEPFYFIKLSSPMGRFKGDQYLPLANKTIDSIQDDFIILPLKNVLSPNFGFTTFFDFLSVKLIFEFNLKF